MISLLFSLLSWAGVAHGKSSAPEAPRPFSLNATVEQRNSFKTMHATNPFSGVSFHTPLNGYRMSVGYRLNPQTTDHTVTASVSVRLLSFGPRRR